MMKAANEIARPSHGPPRHVLSVLPPEIWSAVFKRMKSPKDLLNCYYTNPCWMSLLEPDKGIWQFHLIFPHLFKYLSKSGILKCRQVSKSWKETVDQFLETDQFLLYNSTTHFLFRKTVELNFGSYDEDLAAIERFRIEMAGSPKNPIVSRSVHITDHPNAVPFLREFGIHVWHLTMSVFPEEGTPVHFAEYIRDILICAPNLRTFQLMGYLNDEGRAVDFQAEADQLQRYFMEHELPPMPHLHALDIRLRDIHTIDQTVVIIEQQFLTKYGFQLERLFQGHFIPFLDPFASLTDLSIMIHSADQLSALHGFASHLRVLDLIIHTTQVNFRRMFRAIEHFRCSLKVLSLRFYGQTPHRIHFGKCVQFPKRVCLPFLEELRLEDIYARSDMSFDFLRSLRALRRLELQFSLYYKYEDEPRRRERILVNQHLDDYGKGTEFGMYFSNIWHILPSLQKFTLWHIRHRYRRVFSRACFDYIHQQFRRRLFQQTFLCDV